MLKSLRQIHPHSVQSLKPGLSVIAALCACAVIAGCDQSFNPKGPYAERLVLYSVLSARSDSQFVRVFTTYNPSGHNPLENTIDTYLRDARVTLTVDGQAITLPGVVMPRDDKSRYGDDSFGYLAYPYRLQPGKTYSLIVASPKGNAEATMTVPGKGELLPNNSYILKEPDKYDEDLSVRLKLPKSTHGYLLRLVLEFQTKLGSSVTIHREEIPNAVFAGDGDYFRFEYPVLIRRNSEVLYELVYSDMNAYKAFLIDLKSRYGAITVIGAYYILTQVERNLYTYYNLTNGYQDPYSIRTDLPDFTNIKGGLGIFGAMTEDSVYVDLRASN